MEAGHLVSDDIILGVVREELGKPEAAKGVIFDGVVRTIPQAEGMERILKEKGRKMDAVLFFDVTDEEILARLARRRELESRADDDPEAVATRLKAYREQTAPVLDWYQARNGVAQDSRRRDRPGDRRPGAAGARPIAMITLKSPREIEVMARAGRIVAATLALMRETMRPGLTTEDLDAPPKSSSAATTGRRPPSRVSTAFPRRSVPRSMRRSSTESPRPTRARRGQHRQRGRGGAARRDCTPIPPRPCRSARSVPRRSGCCR